MIENYPKHAEKMLAECAQDIKKCSGVAFINRIFNSLCIDVKMFTAKCKIVKVCYKKI